MKSQRCQEQAHRRSPYPHYDADLISIPLDDPATSGWLGAKKFGITKLPLVSLDIPALLGRGLEKRLMLLCSCPHVAESTAKCHPWGPFLIGDHLFITLSTMCIVMSGWSVRLVKAIEKRARDSRCLTVAAPYPINAPLV